MSERRSARCATALKVNYNKEIIEDSETPKKSRVKSEPNSPKSSQKKSKKTPDSSKQKTTSTVRSGPIEKFLVSPLSSPVVVLKKLTMNETPVKSLVKAEPKSTEKKLKGTPVPLKEKFLANRSKKNEKFISPEVGHRPKRIKKMESPQTDNNEENESSDGEEQVGQGQISEYEKQIQLNIEERKRMFQFFVKDAKDEFKKIATPTVPTEKPQASQRGLKRKKEFTDIEVEPLRMSLRSRKKAGDGQLADSQEFLSLDLFKPGEHVSVAANSTDIGEVDEDGAKFIEQMIPLLEKEGELEKLPGDMQDFLKLMKTFKVSEEGVAKVTHSRIYSMSWHPSASKLLLAVGDRGGNIGLWDVDHVEDKNQGVRAYKAHKQPVNCLSFDRFNPARLLSTSYDGYVRCLDFHTQTKVFDEVFSVKRSNKNWTAYHAQKDASTIVVSQSNGEIVVVDLRSAPGKVSNTIRCFENSARTVSLHPKDDHLFMVCNRYGESGIFDLRYSSSNIDDVAVPVISFPPCAKGIHGSFFSPITGQYALQTCMDHTLKLFDVQQSEAQCIKSINHNNFTGQWLTPFKAVWHPQRDDIFISGSMEQPRRVEMFDAPSGQLLHTFGGEWLASVTSINAFHHSLPIFAGGNSSGRVHVFRP